MKKANILTVKSKSSNKPAWLIAVGQQLTPGVLQGTLDHNSINHVNVITNTMFWRKEVMHSNIHPPYCSPNLPLNIQLLPVWDKHAP